MIPEREKDVSWGELSVTGDIPELTVILGGWWRLVDDADSG